MLDSSAPKDIQKHYKDHCRITEYRTRRYGRRGGGKSFDQEAPDADVDVVSNPLNSFAEGFAVARFHETRTRGHLVTSSDRAASYETDLSLLQTLYGTATGNPNHCKWTEKIRRNHQIRRNAFLGPWKISLHERNGQFCERVEPDVDQRFE